MDACYCLYVHIFMKNIISLKPINFYNSNQFMPDLRFQQSRRDGKSARFELPGKFMKVSYNDSLSD